MSFAVGERGSFKMEFMNMLNSKGPRMEPWGTPDVTVAKSEAIPSRTTLCFCPARYSVNQFRKGPEMSMLHGQG